MIKAELKIVWQYDYNYAKVFFIEKGKENMQIFNSLFGWPWNGE